MTRNTDLEVLLLKIGGFPLDCYKIKTYMKENAQKIEKCMFNFQIYIKPTNI